MKRSIKLLFVFLIVFVSMSVTAIAASASDYTTQAASLKEMGLFIGTDKGYELDRAPTRAEAAVMLVRLLGKESEVKAGTYSHPFKDVPAWVDNYVGYLYENGLTKGTTTTTFSPRVSCNSQMYTVFVLRVLGYTEENESFTYFEAQDFAQNMGLIDSSITSSNTFLRDDVVALSYSALFQKPANNSNTLLENLISQNAVTTAVADKYMDSYDIYKSYLSAMETNYQNTSTEMTTSSSIDISVMGTTMNMTQNSTIKTVIDGSSWIIQSDDVLNYMDIDSQSTSYYYDGWLYTNSSDGKYKVYYPIDSLEDVTGAGIINAEIPFYLINSITKTNTDTETVYTIEYSTDALNYVLGSELSAYTDIISEDGIKLNSLKLTAAYSAEGGLKSQSIDADITATIDDGETYEMGMIINSTANIIKTGDSVTITLPTDLDSYTDLETLS